MSPSKSFLSKPVVTATTLKLHHQDVPVHIFKHPKIEIYLLGTNHLSTSSTNAVDSLIDRVHPHVVGTELCLRRLEMANIHSDDFGYRDQYQLLIQIPKRLRRRAIVELQRLRLTCQAIEYSRQINRDFVTENKKGYLVRPVIVDDLAIGADMFAPFQKLTWRLESREPTMLKSPLKPYRIMLIDRPLEETYLKVVSALTVREYEIIDRYKDDFVNLFLQNEHYGIMMNIWRTNRKLMRIEIQERDVRLAWSLLRAVEINKDYLTGPLRIVALVGQKHVPGITYILRSKKATEFLKRYE